MNCLKCNNPFSICVVIDGKERNLQHRKYCLVCSPFGKHNTRKIDDASVLPKYCKTCGKPLSGRRRNKCNSCNVIRYRQSVKKKLVDYKGGSCQICGYNRCMRNMIFHHRDPSKKEFGITGQTKCYDRLKREADKCVLLCCRCHGEVHDGLVSIPP